MKGCPACGSPQFFFIDKWAHNAMGKREAIEAMAEDLPMPPSLAFAGLWAWPMVRQLWGSKPLKVLRNGAAIFQAGPEGWCGLAGPMLINDKASLADAIKRGTHTFYEPRSGSYLSADEAQAVIA